MSYLIMKFGGSSLRDQPRVEAAARLALREQEAGRRVVLVVSAQGKTTDRLAQQGREAGADPRELDALLGAGEQMSAAVMALNLTRLGGKGVSLTGAQAGIRASGPFGDGEPGPVDPARIRQVCDGGAIPVVAGFQGVTDRGDLITLGRGGSDTTAVVLAAALDGDCRIYTDVCGVFSADPALVERAVRQPLLDFDAMAVLARAGAKVLHGKAARLARARSIPLEICSSKTPELPGTLVRADAKKLPVVGVTCHSLAEDGPLHRLTVVGHATDTPWFRVKLEQGLREAGVVDAPLGGDRLCRWALVPASKGLQALRAVHSAFF